MNIFKKKTCRFQLTCTSITSRKLHLNLAGLQIPCKSLTQNQSSGLIAYPSLLLTILKRTTVATLSTLRQPASIQQLYNTPHKMTFLAFPVPLFIANIFCKNVKIPCAFYLPFSQRLRTFYCLYESHTPLCKLVCHASSQFKALLLLDFTYSLKAKTITHKNANC